jgi:hypothetical protein
MRIGHGMRGSTYVDVPFSGWCSRQCILAHDAVARRGGDRTHEAKSDQQVEEFVSHEKGAAVTVVERGKLYGAGYGCGGFGLVLWRGRWKGGY